MAPPDSPELSVFTLEAANALIPRLSAIVAEQLLRRAEIETRLKELKELLGGELGDTLSLEPGDTADVRARKTDLIARIEDYRTGWRALEETGAILKDPRIGLVDFYGRVDGKRVWLCWKYGEPEVSHYHALDEGFSGRKAIETSMRARLLN